MDELSHLTTEQPNPASAGIDAKDTRDILAIICEEDKKVPQAVEAALDQLAPFIDRLVQRFLEGGRLFYVGAGTSGRLGVLDASECPPTYGTDPDMVQGVIAGGMAALTRSVEAAEDSEEAGKAALLERHFSGRDVLFGITASGQAPFVIGAMKYAGDIGATVGALGCNQQSGVFKYAEFPVFVDVGPEIVSGSTRMKAGSAQKLVLNMISTSAMIRLGKVYNNLMVDLKPVNHKLLLRARRLIALATGAGAEEAATLFEASEGQVKTAIVMKLAGLSRAEAQAALAKNGGRIADTVADAIAVTDASSKNQ